MMKIAFLLTSFISFIGCFHFSECEVVHSRPCTPEIMQNCTRGRFVACGTTTAQKDLSLLHARDASKCHVRGGRLIPGQKLLVQFFSGAPGGFRGACMEIVVQVGECWGHDSDGDSYDCLGLCGVGCQPTHANLCSNWARNCLKHDVCSYYYNSKGGAADPHCGWAFNIAAADYLQPCMIDSTCTLPSFNTKTEVCSRVLPIAAALNDSEVGLLKLFSTALDPTVRAVRMSSFQQDQVRQMEKPGEVSNDVSFGT